MDRPHASARIHFWRVSRGSPPPLSARSRPQLRRWLPKWLPRVHAVKTMEAARQSGAAANLSRRERDVVRLLRAGKSYKAIALDLGIRLGTVRPWSSAPTGSLASARATSCQRSDRSRAQSMTPDNAYLDQVSSPYCRGGYLEGAGSTWGARSRAASSTSRCHTSNRRYPRAFRRIAL